MPDLFRVAPEVLVHLESLLPDDLNATLRELVTSLFLHLVEDEEAVEKLGLPRLAELAIGQLDRASVEIGGSSFYFPRGITSKLSARDREIVSKWKGWNKRQLAREYKLSDMRIDQILNAWRKEEVARRQGNLNLDPED